MPTGLLARRLAMGLRILSDAGPVRDEPRIGGYDAGRVGRTTVGVAGADDVAPAPCGCTAAEDGAVNNRVAVASVR